MMPQLSNSTRNVWLRRLYVTSGLLLLFWLLLWALGRFLIVNTGPAKADALVVLSGSAEYRERARWATQLFREGRAPVILVTNDNLRGGWSSADQKNPFFYELEVDELLLGGVPEDRIKLVSEPVSSTYSEALALRQYAVNSNLKSIIVVTSPYHSRRALWTMRQVFAGTNIEVDSRPVRPGDESPPPSRWCFTIRGWREVAGEYVKLVYYWVRYRS